MWLSAEDLVAERRRESPRPSPDGTETVHFTERQARIVGLGSGAGTEKTVTDECPACEGNSQLDNYSTSNACSLTGLGSFQTIRTNR